MAHRFPFQRSTSVSEPMPEMSALPTAVHFLAEVHETPLRPSPMAPAGRGKGSVVHRCPFHRSVSPPPTAMHILAFGQDTAASSSFSVTAPESGWAGRPAAAEAADAIVTAEDAATRAPDSSSPATPARFFADLPVTLMSAALPRQGRGDCRVPGHLPGPGSRLAARLY
jgi:hypothetical protein